MTELQTMIIEAVAFKPKEIDKIIAEIIDKAGDKHLSVKIKATALALVADGLLNMNDMWKIEKL